MNTAQTHGSRGAAHQSAGRRSLWKAPAFLAALIVSILFVASLLVHDWNWPPQPFIIVGVLTFSLGLVAEVITRKRDSFVYRAGVGIAFTSGFLLMWSNFVQMADVTPTAAIYFTVPIIGVAGAIIARLRPKQMARALLVTSVAQLCAMVTVLILMLARHPEITSLTMAELRGLGGNGILAMLFVVSALLFRASARHESTATLA